MHRNDSRAAIRPRLHRLLTPALFAGFALTAPACGVAAGNQENDFDGSEPVDQSTLALSSDIDARQSILITDFDVVSHFTLKEVLDRLSNGQALALFRQMFDTEQLSQNAAGPGTHCDSNSASGSINGWPAECPRGEGLEATRDPFADPQSDDAYMATTLSNRFDLAPVTGENCGEYRINFARRSGIASGLQRLFIAFEARLPNPNPSAGLAGCRPVIEFWRSLSGQTADARTAALRKFYFDGLPGFRPVIHPSNFGAVEGPQTGQVRVNQFLFIQSELGDWSAREFRLIPQALGSLPVQFVPTFDKDVPARPLFDPTSTEARAQSFQGDFFPKSVERLALADLNTMNYVGPVPKEFNSGDSHMPGGSTPVVELFNDYGAAFGSSASNFRSRIQAELNAIGSPLTPDHIVARATSLSCGGCHNLSQDLQADHSLGLPSEFPRSVNFVHVSEHLVDKSDGSGQRYETSSLLATVLPYRQQLMVDFLTPVYGFERTSAWSSTQAQLALSSTTKTEGSSSLRIVPSRGFSEIKSVPFSAVGAGSIGSDMHLDVFLPATNPSFRGYVTAFISIPSARIFNEWLGQVSLDGLPRGAFSTLKYTLPARVRRNLGYGVADISITLQLNVSATTAAYYIDNLRFH